MVILEFSQYGCGCNFSRVEKRNKFLMMITDQLDFVKHRPDWMNWLLARRKTFRRGSARIRADPRGFARIRGGSSSAEPVADEGESIGHWTNHYSLLLQEIHFQKYLIQNMKISHYNSYANIMENYDFKL